MTHYLWIIHFFIVYIYSPSNEKKKKIPSSEFISLLVLSQWKKWDKLIYVWGFFPSANEEEEEEGDVIHGALVPRWETNTRSGWHIMA